MFGLRFSKLPRHRQFSYTPLYYDEQKEELKDRVNQIRKEMGHEVKQEEDLQERMRKAFRSKQSAERFSQKPTQKFYGLKIVLIALFLGYVFYKVLNSDLLETIFGL